MTSAAKHIRIECPGVQEDAVTIEAFTLVCACQGVSTQLTEQSGNGSVEKGTKRSGGGGACWNRSVDVGRRQQQGIDILSQCREARREP
eukprot:7423934-Alexandrium_andersonii.AAC.1